MIAGGLHFDYLLSPAGLRSFRMKMGKLANRGGASAFRRSIFVILSLCACFSALDSGFSQETPTNPAEIDTSLGKSDSRVSVSDLREREISENFQISVKGENSMIRSMFSAFARDIRRDFRSKLQLRPIDWTIPIHVELYGNPREVYFGEPVRVFSRLYENDRFRITVQVKIHDRFEEKDFTNGLLEALILDQILQSHSKAPAVVANRNVEVPQWLVHGFSQSMEHRKKGSSSAFYAGFLKSNQLLGTEKIFALKDTESLNPVSLAIFRASSAALVETLLDQPGGHLTLRKVLGDLAVRDNPNLDALLRQHFPNFREMESGVEKWWALQLATLAQQQSFEYFSPEETEARLDRALQISFEEKAQQEAKEERKGIFGKLKLKVGRKNESEGLPSFEGTLEQYPEFGSRKDLREGLLQNYNELQTLLAYGFPLYRPLITRYIAAFEKIASGKTKDLAIELRELQELRTKIRDTMVRTRDFMNYYEATAAPQKSEAFDNYMKLRRSIENAPPPRRNDRITEYLDDLEIEFR